MKLREAWKLSAKPYFEVTFRSTQLSRSGFGGQAGMTDPNRRIRGMIRSAKISKIVFALFICLGTAVPLLQYPLSRTGVTLAASVSFSLAIGLAYIILYSLQVLPSFSGGEAFSLLSTLPLEDRDFSLVTMMSFLRTFDYLILSAFATQVLGVALLTGSVAATLLTVVASLMNVVFAVAIALWLSGLFYRNITKGGRSKGAAVTRVVFLVTWGLAAMSTGFMFSLIGYLLPAIDAVLARGLSQSAVGLLLSVLHPFTEGMVVADSVYPQFLGTAAGGAGLVLAATAFYVFLAFAVGRRTFAAINGVAQGGGVRIVRQAAKEFLLRTRRPTQAYVVKDLRVASKTPSTAFIFALPIFEMLIIGLNTSAFTFLRATSVVSATALGCFFTLFSSSVLLNTEGVGLDYTMSLPIGPAVIIDAKSLVATVSYLPVPLVIAALIFFKGTTSQVLVLIPFIEVLAVSAAAMAQLSFFIRGYRKKETRTGPGKPKQGQSGFQSSGFSLMAGGDILRMGEALLVAAVIIAAPMAVYGAAYFTTHGHLLAVGCMAVAAAAELAAVRAWIRRM